MYTEIRNNNYYRPDRFPWKVTGFESAALTRDGQLVDPAAANALYQKLKTERLKRIQTQGHG
jgi:hypothetical protein